MKETNKYVKPTGCLYLLDYFYIFLQINLPAYDSV